MLLLLNFSQTALSIGATLHNHLNNNLNEKRSDLEKVQPPQSVARIHVRERASLIDHKSTEDALPQPAATSAGEEHDNLWDLLENHVQSQQHASSASAI